MHIIVLVWDKLAAGRIHKGLAHIQNCRIWVPFNVSLLSGPHIVSAVGDRHRVIVAWSFINEMLDRNSRTRHERNSPPDFFELRVMPQQAERSAAVIGEHRLHVCVDCFHLSTELSSLHTVHFISFHFANACDVLQLRNCVIISRTKPKQVSISDSG